MNNTLKMISEDLVVLNLGAGADKDLGGPVAKALSYIELDAGTDSKTSADRYKRHVSLKKGVSGKEGRRIFHRRKWWGCSSFLDVKPELAKAYAHEELVSPAGDIELECLTMKGILEACGIQRADFIKTDLEGLDYAVLASDGSLTGEALAVQCELRFEPFYEGEPHFHTVVEYMLGLGFDLITLDPMVWKYATPNREKQRNGRLVGADAVFFLNPDQVMKKCGEKAHVGFVKQILIAKLLHLDNYSEFIFENIKHELPQEVRQEIRNFIARPLSLKGALQRALNAAAGTILRFFPNSLTMRMHTLSVMVSRAMNVDNRFKHIGTI